MIAALALVSPPPSADSLHAARARRCATDMRREARALLELAEMVSSAATPDALTSIERATGEHRHYASVIALDVSRTGG
jgi:hypothetical protein